jgi:hypothetical protein
VPWLAAAIAFVALAALVWSAARAPGDTSPAVSDHDEHHAAQRILLVAAGVIALAYVALVVASRAFADPDIPFDFRLAVPLVPLIVASVAVIAARAWSVMSRPSRVVGMLALAMWGLAAVRTSYEQVTYALAEGDDFASREWRDSPMLAWARAQDPSRALFTNWPCAIWFHLDRPVRDLPSVTDDATMHAFVARLRAVHGAVVAWNLQSPETAQTDSIVVHAGLVRVATFDDGNVFEAAPLAGTSVLPLPVPPAVAPSPARR